MPSTVAMSASKSQPSEQAVSPLNFIYACALCCATFADIYEGHSETVQGLSDGINPKDRLVTKLFLANCCHVFCSKHLEGGAPSFHPVGQRPQAPCPVCTKEKGDSQSRELYSVRGFNKDEYDPQIPAQWFLAPPVRKNGKDEDMEALRFQYIALIKYCQNTYASRKSLQEELSESKKQIATMKNISSTEHTKMINLQQENEQLRKNAGQLEDMTAELEKYRQLDDELTFYRNLGVTPRDIETFVTHKAEIRHYLKQLPSLIDQNERMQRRLASLGFAMAVEPVPRLNGLDPRAFDSDDIFPEDRVDGYGKQTRETASSHTAGRSAYTPARIFNNPSSPFAQRPMKRQRVETPPLGTQAQPPSSRDAMPPPAKPVSRLRSMRRIFPTFRKKPDSGNLKPLIEHDLSEQHNGYMDVDICDQGENHGCTTSPTKLRSDAPYMSGALPVEQPLQMTHRQNSQMLARMGISDGKSDFTFRATTPGNASGITNSHLPTEPSYIRLMDVLSNDNGFELGLKDPRYGQSQNGNHASDRHVAKPLHQQTHWQEPENRERPGFGQSYHLQWPSTSSASGNDELLHSHDQQTDKQTHSFLGDPKVPVTPVPRRKEQSNIPIDSVVSPFFGSNYRSSPTYRPTVFTEPQDSFNPSGVCQSPNRERNESRQGLYEQRSLNGLSFFETPVRSQNRHVESLSRSPQKLVTATSLVPVSRRVTSRGLIVHPRAEHSDSLGRTRHEFPTRQIVHNRFPQSGSTLSYRSEGGSSTRRTAQLPSTMPSIVSTVARPTPQWASLQQTGVRSSRQHFNDNSRNMFGSATNGRYSNTGRRSIRR